MTSACIDPGVKGQGQRVMKCAAAAWVSCMTIRLLRFLIELALYICTCDRFISSARAVGAKGFKIWWTEIQLPTAAALALGKRACVSIHYHVEMEIQH